MPNNRRLTKKTIKGKDGLHPGSRKASQLGRVFLRTAKLGKQSRLRSKASISKLDRPLFFLHSLSSPEPLTLSALRELIVDVYLIRSDPRIQELESERRQGRPKSAELIELEETRRRERAEWETGLEVPDLTHGPTVKILWSMRDTSLQASHLDLLRLIRLFKDKPEEVVVSRPGRWQNMGLSGGDELDTTKLDVKRGDEVKDVDMLR